MDDGTGIIEVKQWPTTDTNASGDMDDELGGEFSMGGGGMSAKLAKLQAQLQRDSWARVFGRLKGIANRRNVLAHIVKPITDFNEIQYHLLEATYAHLYFTRGPPPSLTSADGNAANDNMYNQQGANSDIPHQANQSNATLAAVRRMSPLAQRVYEALRNVPQNNEGLHIQHIANGLGEPLPNVMKAGDELLACGVMYTTVDDNTWAAMDC